VKSAERGRDEEGSTSQLVVIVAIVVAVVATAG
jgi:hypothetical protein